MNFKTSENLTVCIDARLVDGLAGGMQQVVIGLANGLSNLPYSHDKFLFLCSTGHETWLKPYIGGNCKLLTARLPIGQKIEKIFNAFPITVTLFRKMMKFSGRRKFALPISDGTVEAAGVHVMHFTLPSAFITQVPSIYHIHDLQHLHYPNYFPLYMQSNREHKYREFCNQAQIATTSSRWMGRQLIQYYNLPDSKVKAVPLAPPADAYPIPSEDDLIKTMEKYFLPESFLLFPAQTWPHKNHLNLLKALDLLRNNHNMHPTVVCTGRKNSYYSTIHKMSKELSMLSQIIFTGYIPSHDLHCLYRRCRFLIFPSKYEGWGLPVTEAMRLGVPVACSDIPVLKEQAGNAAVLFNPEDPLEIANSIRQLWTNSSLRKTMAKKGIKTASRFNWEKTARTYLQIYHQIANRE